MKATIESTEKIIEFDGIPARVWEGTTESGVKVHMYVTRVAISTEEKIENIEIFQRELEQQKAPSAETQAIPLRMIL